MCQYKDKCWRRSYSEFYLKKDKFAIPPKRDIIFLEGFANIAMMPNRGMFCENMPSSQCEANLCPALSGGYVEFCKEYIIETKKLANLKKKRENKFQNSSFRMDIPKETRRQVAASAGYKCVYCGTPHNKIVDGKKTKCVVDHFIPLAQGGHPTNPSNLVFACSKCNQEKGANIWQIGCKKNQEIF